MKTPTIEELFVAGIRAQKTGAVDDWAELSRIGEALSSSYPSDSYEAGFCRGVAVLGAMRAYDMGRATILLEQSATKMSPEEISLLRTAMDQIKAELEAS
jgi:hypothetical protein